MNVKTASTLIGDDIFFNFIETDYNDPGLDTKLIQKIHTGELDGVVIKGVMSPEEVDEMRSLMPSIPESEKLNTRTGQTFPVPFATITDSGERLDNYMQKVKTFRALPFGKIVDRLKTFFNRIGEGYQVGVPHTVTTDEEVAPGNFRIFLPDYGGLYVHCGYLLQSQSPHYYTVVSEMAKEGQLSYFMVLQYPEDGGELTIYDMLWKDIQEKDDQAENEYVIDPQGNRVYLKDVKKFAVKPNPGDVLVFSGGPIWHRVEDIKGTRPRITFGGFINFTQDDKGFYYWS